MTVYLSLGSNLGDREATIGQALALLAIEVGSLDDLSSFYYSAPWGFESTNEFCNCCASLETKLSPLDVLHVTQAIERELGRTQKSVDGIYHDRTIDIDLLIYVDRNGKEITMNTDELTLPHPRMKERDFVLVPLKEIYPKK